MTLLDKVLINNVTISGKLTDEEDGFNAVAFEGIPYADEDSFKRLEDSTLVVINEKFSPIGKIINCKDSDQEFCLYLNIYLPKKTSIDTINLPVFIDFSQGLTKFNNQRKYITEMGVIYVSVSFRDSASGFLNGHNFGLHDMVNSIKFLSENIKYFGGDKNNFIVFGQRRSGFLADAMILNYDTILENKGTIKLVATLDGNVNMPFFAWEHQQNEVFEDFCEFSNLSHQSCFADLQNLDLLKFKQLSADFEKNSKYGKMTFAPITLNDNFEPDFREFVARASSVKTARIHFTTDYPVYDQLAQTLPEIYQVEKLYGYEPEDIFNRVLAALRSGKILTNIESYPEETLVNLKNHYFGIVLIIFNNKNEYPEYQDFSSGDLAAKFAADMVSDFIYKMPTIEILKSQAYPNKLVLNPLKHPMPGFLAGIYSKFSNDKR